MNVYRKLFSFVPDKKLVTVLAILSSSCSTLLTIFAYFYIYKFLVAAIVNTDYSASKYFAIIITLLLIASSLFYLLSGYFSHILGFAFERSIRIKGIDGLINSSFKFIDTHPSGLIRKTIDDNAAKTHTAVAHFIPDFPKFILTIILTFILAFTIDFRLGASLIAITIVGIYFYTKMFSGRDMMTKYQEALNRLSAETVEYIRNMQVIKVFGTDLSSVKNLNNSISDYATTAYDYCQICKRPYVLFQWVFIGAMAIFIIPISYFFIPNNLLNNEFIVLLLMLTFLTGILFSTFNKIMYTGQHLFNANFAITSLNTIYDEMKNEALDFGTDNEIANYNIVFDNVTFSYGDKNVLENFSIELEEGKIYALTGPSGSGKSTIAKLISGFYKVNDGSIKIGDKNILSYDKNTIVENISFIFQSTKLFKTSIYENVLFAKKDATREEVLNALHLANCDDIINKFPERENTIIGSKGVYLSGGEIQRIAIARAILKNAPILIMDEASASIDPDNEYELLKAFKSLMQGKTVIMIAHRLSSLNNIDEILLIKDGKVIERGSQAELLESNSYYQELKSFYNKANDWTVI